MCDRFPRKFDVQTSYKPSNYVRLDVRSTFVVVNIKFPRSTYHTIVPSTEELCCLNSIYHFSQLFGFGGGGGGARFALADFDILMATTF